jgi:hypothetical protein
MQASETRRQAIERELMPRALASPRPQKASFVLRHAYFEIDLNLGTVETAFPV